MGDLGPGRKRAIPAQGIERQRGADENKYVLFDAPSLPSILRRGWETGSVEGRERRWRT